MNMKLLRQVCILAQPSVAVVDEVVDERGTRDVATEYLSCFYSDDTENSKNFYRPSNPEYINEYADTFDLNVNLVTIKDFDWLGRYRKSILPMVDF